MTGLSVSQLGFGYRSDSSWRFLSLISQLRSVTATAGLLAPAL